jgi:GH24 family phage-related lysozyme (muramidase)
VIHKGEDFTAGIDEDRASHLLANDVAVAERAVLRFIRVPLSDGQFAALVSFTFNLGAGALQRSSLRQKLNRGEYNDVPVEFMKWVWGGGRKLQGLVVRRRAESMLFSA